MLGRYGMSGIDGWNYHTQPTVNEDRRKLVTLEKGGQIWVGVRYWHPDGYWTDGMDRETTHIKAWQDFPSPA